MNKKQIERNFNKHLKKALHASTKVNQRVSSQNPTTKILTELFKWFVIIFFGFLIIFPFYYMLSMSLMSYDEITNPDFFGDNPIFWSNNPTLANFITAINDGFLQAFMFSSAVLVVNIVFKLFVCALLGYAFGNYQFKGKEALWYILLLTMAIPEVSLLSGQFWVVKKLSLDQGLMMLLTLSGPFIASIFTAYMFRNAFESIPSSVKEASMIDGVSGAKYFTNIALPMVKHTTWTVIILTAFASWNSYMWPAMILKTTDYDTIPLWLFDVGETFIVGGGGGESRFEAQVQMAGSIMAIIPTLVFYICFRNKVNNVVSGNGANKG